MIFRFALPQGNAAARRSPKSYNAWFSPTSGERFGNLSARGTAGRRREPRWSIVGDQFPADRHGLVSLAWLPGSTARPTKSTGMPMRRRRPPGSARKTACRFVAGAPVGPRTKRRGLVIPIHGEFRPTIPTAGVVIFARMTATKSTPEKAGTEPKTRCAS